MLTRRDFVAQIAAAAAGVTALSAAPGAAAFAKVVESVPARRGAVVSFHMDRPYVDPTGTAMPYYPPSGTRSAAAAAELSEEAFRRMQCYA